MEDIDRHISELLFDHDCVIVPALGGFLASNQSARIMMPKHIIYPPFRHIAFNIFLKHNDGLLANRLVEVKKINYTEALQLIENYTTFCFDTLEKGKKFIEISTFKDDHGLIGFYGISAKVMLLKGDIKNAKKFADLSLQYSINAGNPGYSAAVKGALSLSGGLYQKEYIDKDDVPFMAYHGTADVVVPFGYGLNVYRFNMDGDSSCNTYARSLGIKSNLVTVKGGGHTDIYDPTGPYAANLADFLNKASLFLKQLVCGENITAPTQDIDNQVVKIYPNPSDEMMTLSFDKNGSNSLSNVNYTEGYRITVYDIVGRQVFDSGKQYSDSFNLNKKDFGKGLYLARITVGDKASPIVKKIVFE